MDLKKWFNDPDNAEIVKELNKRPAPTEPPGNSSHSERHKPDRYSKPIGPQEVIITGIDINFFSLMFFLVRLIVAAVPAMILALIALGFIASMFWPFIAAFSGQ